MFLRKMLIKQLAQRGSQLTRPFASRAGRNFFATSCAILGVFASSRVLANSHGGLITTPRAGFITFHGGLDVSAILKTLKTDSAYNSSVILYASSLLNDSELYSKALSEITSQLQNTPDNSFKAWMLGRVLLAKKNKLDHMKGKPADEKTRFQLEKLEKDIEATRDQLKNLLSSDIANDEMRAWALGYLAALNLEEYQKNKEEMLKAANALREAKDALEKPANALWADVMNLQAAARAHDKPTFELILKQMQQFTGKETVAEALAQIPANDWRAWAMGMVSESAALMGDVKLYQALNQPLSAATHEAVSNKSTANAMLAQISADTAEKLTQPRQIRTVNRK